MVKRKTKSIAATIMTLIIISVILIGCNAGLLFGCDPSEEWWKGLERPTFKEMCVTTEDGFVYYLDDEIGLCIIELPDSEEVTIPEYIDGHRVMQLGYKEIGFMYSKTHVVDGNHVKKLNMYHIPSFYCVKFANLETVVYMDFTSLLISNEEEIMRVNRMYNYVKEVELKKGDKNISNEEIKANVIEIPKCVNKIEAGIFDGLEGVTIKTAHDINPEGWEEGWNGNCEVVWGEEIKYSFSFWTTKNEEGFFYYNNRDTDEGIYILNVPDKEELIIPEYIDGKKVLTIGYYPEGVEHYMTAHYVKKLTIQHQFDTCYKINNGVREDYASFYYLTNLIFIDFLYCNISASEEEIIVPCYIGEKSKSVPIVELRKSDREYSLEGFMPKVIIIPKYVEIIEAGVFDGLENVTIKTSYGSKPEGWEEGWNGNCEVIWGVELN